MQEIPFTDIRATSPVTLLEEHRHRAIQLLNACRDMYGLWSRVASAVGMPIADKLAQTWLRKSHNPYYEEIASYHSILGTKGVFALNMCYEWGCTSGVFRDSGSILLARVLDWPFPALGENLVVALQRGRAEDFYNITWPGVSGVFQAAMPGRFAASLNQAPMRRYNTGLLMDWGRGRLAMYRQVALPPAHLLRKAFETCSSYAEAKHMLATEAVSIPVIYTLCGTKGTEGCVIERLENATAVRELGANENICATNHFESHLNGIGSGWKARSGDSDSRVLHAYSIRPQEATMSFDWFRPPVAHPLSRLAMLVCPATAKLAVIGTNGPAAVTAPFVIKSSS